MEEYRKVGIAAKPGWLHQCCHRMPQHSKGHAIQKARHRKLPMLDGVTRSNTLQAAALTVMHTWQQGCQEDSGSEEHTEDSLTDAQEPRCVPPSYAASPHSRRWQALCRVRRRVLWQPGVLAAQVL